MSHLYVLDQNDPIIYDFLLPSGLDPTPVFLSTWKPLGDFQGNYVGLTMGPEDYLFVGLHPAAFDNSTSLLKINTTTGSVVSRLANSIDQRALVSRSLIYDPVSDCFYGSYTLLNSTSRVRCNLLARLNSPRPPLTITFPGGQVLHP